MSFPSRVRWSLCLLSLALGTVLGLLYALRPDWAAAVTIIPAWAWLVPGALPLLLGRPYPRTSGAALVIWVVFLLAFVEEPRGHLRALFTGDPYEHLQRSDYIRVATLNCGSTGAACLPELAVHEPDLVLLQESPSDSAMLREFATRLFGVSGDALWGPDASILYRGELRSAEDAWGQRHYLAARLTVPWTDAPVEVFSVRLQTSQPLLNLLRPGTWRSQQALRRRQKAQMRELVEASRHLGDGLPVIVGGDFNVPQGDAVFDVLEDRLDDAFAVAGRGTGNTIVNDLPLLRIDQIWVSPHFDVLNARTVESRVSDHRMVIADLRLRK